MASEGTYQRALKKKIRKLLPGAYVLKNDPDWLQGFPDLTILYNNRWAVLEVKKSENERFQPNQEYYVEDLNNLSYSSVIFPENEKEVLHELQRALGA